MKLLERFQGIGINLILANNEECVYSDLKGLKLICNNSNKITNKNKLVENEEEESAPVEEVQLTTNASIEDNAAVEKKTNFDLFIMLREKGYTLKQIHQDKLLALTYNSLKNYNCKYNKLRVAQATLIILI